MPCHLVNTDISKDHIVHSSPRSSNPRKVDSVEPHDNEVEDTWKHWELHTLNTLSEPRRTESLAALL